MNTHCHSIDNAWHEGSGTPLVSRNPANDSILFAGHEATEGEVQSAFAAAARAFIPWSALPVAERLSYLENFRALLQKNSNSLVETLSQETGKPLWESQTEIQAMIAKLEHTRKAYEERSSERAFSVGAGIQGFTRFRPLGVSVVLGPFNLPAHLPHGHILPALLAGNTVILKPSPLTPGIAVQIMELWQQSGLPPGVLNCLQGGRETAERLATHPDLKALYFTGSVTAGLALHRAFAGHPEKMLALEMGGNNPLIVHDIQNLKAASRLTILSAFITSGQRCTCARRLIVPRGKEGDAFLDRLVEDIAKIKVAAFTAKPEPFMGPVIHRDAAQNILRFAENLKKRGGIPLHPLRVLPQGEAFLQPGLMDVSAVTDRLDEECFGPFLQVIRTGDFEEAVREANQTRFGLAAGLLSDNADCYNIFQSRIRAGIVNWNRPTTGASSAMPFGGVGLSGNYRPGATFAADYTAYPVASLEYPQVLMPEQEPPGLK